MEKIVVLDSKSPLLIFCTDSIVVYDITTFLSYILGKLNITYWYEPAKDKTERVSDMFTILFEEVLKNKKNKSN